MYASEDMGEEVEPRGRAPARVVSGEDHAEGGEVHAVERRIRQRVLVEMFEFRPFSEAFSGLFVFDIPAFNDLY